MSRRYGLDKPHEHICISCSTRWLCRSPNDCENRWRYICLTCLEKRVRGTQEIKERLEQGVSNPNPTNERSKVEL